MKWFYCCMENVAVNIYTAASISLHAKNLEYVLLQIKFWNSGIQNSICLWMLVLGWRNENVIHRRYSVQIRILHSFGNLYLGISFFSVGHFNDYYSLEGQETVQHSKKTMEWTVVVIFNFSTFYCLLWILIQNLFQFPWP